MITIAQDSDKTTFQIWKQDQMNSCGVASAWMARGMVRQMSFAEEEWGLAQRMYQNAVQSALAPLGISSGGPRSLDPRAFASNQATVENTFARFGLYGAQLAGALRSEGITVNHIGFNGLARMLNPVQLAETTPAIVLVCWQGGGGHFVVAARQARNGKIVFLDPWDGAVNEQANDGKYRAQSGSTGIIGEILYLS